MCNICGAFVLIKGKSLEVISTITGTKYTLTGSAQDAEKAPCKYIISKNGEAGKEFESSVYSLTKIVTKGGFGLNNAVRTIEHDDWIENHFI